MRIFDNDDIKSVWKFFCSESEIEKKNLNLYLQVNFIEKEHFLV